jgi:hypothetical protein
VESFKILALCIANWCEVTLYPNFSAVNIIFGLFGIAKMDNLECIIGNFMKWHNFLSMSSICCKGVGYIPSVETDWLTTAECYDGVICSSV